MLYLYMYLFPGLECKLFEGSDCGICSLCSWCLSKHRVHSRRSINTLKDVLRTNLGRHKDTYEYCLLTWAGPQNSTPNC